ncbi:tRNA uracil 4-sulfurtransferase ThiI [uncultured Anaerococcus sp.]|uniref:tRNA uracil 4-sulfurtransferase ThiI n=1 Tax=uncultured Anaerococcus sp. TaxID=293428 RepID=UPI0026031584|nr:tRNA uracil 4-sulfurtransferase ThiI [uncultured Anaerococcus sp.]
MEALLAISFGELFLKGSNRKTFFNSILNHIKSNIEDIGYDEIYVESAKLYIKADEKKHDILIEEIGKVFGIAYIDRVYKCDKDVDDIYKTTKYILSNNHTKKNESFKVETTRVDKSFPYKSPELCSKIGGLILEDFENLSVDIHNPDFKVYIDIKNRVYVYTERYPGLGGLPLGTSGNGLLLLSGGIDSPVAGFMMAKRGMKIDSIHFHSYPFTSKQAHQKAVDLAKLMGKYTGNMKFYSVNLSEIYKAIATNCDRRETTILSRRFMMRIANEISKKNSYQALITGESLGQVASQTLESVAVIEDSSELPILRPLIAIDKKDIVDKAIEIDTYEKSIEPFDDCCSIFAPDKPITKPKLHFIKMSEEKLEIDKLIKDAIDNMEIIEL